MNDLVALRREFHTYPEAGWTEFRTTVRIIEEEVVSSFAAEEEQSAAPVEEAPAEIPVVAEEESFADDFRLDLEGLKFGRNYPTES